MTQLAKKKIEQIVKCKRAKLREPIVEALDAERETIKQEYQKKITAIKDQSQDLHAQEDAMTKERDSFIREKHLDRVRPGCYNLHPTLAAFDDETDNQILQLWAKGVIPNE